jgi:hypothetical protein
MKCLRKEKLYNLTKEQNYRPIHRWVCHCGKEFEARSDANLKSCGCVSTSGTWAHGHEKGRKKTPELRTYSKMIQRCYKEYDKSFNDYGGRGIKVCERWLGPNGFKHFLEDMGYKPSSKHSIDRIDVDGNYEPDNCRWATKQTQANNTRSNIYLTYKGMTKTRAEWIRLFGEKRHNWDHLRMRNGMTNQEILVKMYNEWQSRASGG